jgi:LysM repeat protein
MKLKLPRFPMMPRKKKLRASAARRAAISGADFEDMSEPNMKLSRALLIVLLLHIVAVAGIIAFNAIKSREGPGPVVRSSVAKTTPASSATPTTTTPRADAKPRSTVAPSKTEKRSKTADNENARTYTVAKGDTPLTIAKKFNVPFDDLLAANHIDDPRKLRVGQKLIIPIKNPKTKKTDE